MGNFYKELIREIKRKDYSEKELAKLKRDFSSKYGLGKIPTNIEILLQSGKEELSQLKKKLMTKPARTISGVAPIAVMSKPFPCPHGKCLMCPGGKGSYFGNVPQSYTGKEPATMRGKRNNYDSYFQVFNRLEQYVLLGHCIDKIELIVMGGTFPSFPIKYQKEFVWGIWKALNDFSKLFFKRGELDFLRFKRFFELPTENLGDEKRIKRIHQKLKIIKKINLEKKIASFLFKNNFDLNNFRGKGLIKKTRISDKELEKEQAKNEKAKVRGVALCIETRPDYCGKKEIELMLRLGCTRVELGAQHLDDDVLKKIKRGHKVEEIIEATKRLKNNFLKVGYHIMPGLPGSSEKKDKQMFEKLFSEQDFRPDALKIYPCMVTKGTELYEQWKEGKYKPLTTEEAAKLIARFKERIPEYVRVLRVQRDIPTKQTVAGAGMTNLRQYIQEKYKPKCRCIRCREPKGKKIDFEEVVIKIKKYEASGGEEFFISAEEVKKDLLLGFCRLRIFDGEAGVRELHVYGTATGIGEEGRLQHKGIGKKLLGEAEKIVQKEQIKKLKIISGVGAREYYKRLGYTKEGAYMVKKFC